MILPAYDVPREFSRPTTEGCPRRAVEDRDLMAEARDEDGTAGAMLDTYLVLYPPIPLGPGVTIIPMAN